MEIKIEIVKRDGDVHLSRRTVIAHCYVRPDKREPVTWGVWWYARDGDGAIIGVQAPTYRSWGGVMTRDVCLDADVDAVVDWTTQSVATRRYVALCASGAPAALPSAPAHAPVPGASTSPSPAVPNAPAWLMRQH